MKRAIFLGLVTSAAASGLFLAGVFVGRSSIETSVYDAPISAAEMPLIGLWQISANVEPKQSTIEFRLDRTGVKRLPRGDVGLVMTWGVLGDKLSMQNGHYPGEQGDYMPPAIFLVRKIGDNQIDLVSWDGNVEWKLSRL